MEFSARKLRKLCQPALHECVRQFEDYLFLSIEETFYLLSFYLVIMFSCLGCEIFVQFESSDRSNGVNFHLDFYLRRSPWTQLQKGKQYTFFNERHKTRLKFYLQMNKEQDKDILNVGKLLAMKLCWYVCVWTSRAEQSHPSDGSST